jgi:hypothetical protein
MGPITFPMGPYFTKGDPTVPRWDPIWLGGHMFTGRVFRRLRLRYSFYYPSRVACSICLQQLLFAGHALSAF